jgi:hypothetical protein
MGCKNSKLYENRLNNIGDLNTVGLNFVGGKDYDYECIEDYQDCPAD